MPKDARAELVQRVYAALSEGDDQALAALVAEDAVWRVPGKNLVAGEYDGRGAVLRLQSKIMEFTKGTFEVELRDVCENERLLVALTHYTASRGAKQLSLDTCDAFRFQDEVVLTWQSHPADQHAADAFFSYRGAGEVGMP